MKTITRLLTLAIFIASELILSAQPSGFVPRGIGGGGALYFPSVNPANENEFYVSCDMSELFHSLDFGLTYSQVDFSKLQVFSTSTYEFTNNPDIAYSNFNDGNEGYPVKTTDGGSTWIPMTGYDIGTYGHVYSMKANYNNPSQLLIGSYGDILFSGNGGTSFALVRHAANMGVGLIIGGVFWDDPYIYIGTNEGIISSSNGGTSFSVMTTSGISSGQVLWSFAGAKAGDKRFVCITANTGDVYNGLMPWDYYNFAKGIYVMDNANGIWISKSSGINFSNDFVMYAAMAGNDINTIYLGGHDNALSAPLVLKSSYGGTTWEKKFNTTYNENIITGWEGYDGDKNWSWSETCFGINVAPNNSAKVLFGSYSSVHISSNGGNNWKQAYVSSADEHPAGASTQKKMPYHSIGLESTTCWQVHWQDENTMMGCFSDIGGIRSADAGTSWGFQYSGFSVNSLYRIAKGSKGVMYGGCSNIHDIYQSTFLKDGRLDPNDPNGKIIYSTDNGANWTDLHIFSHPVFWLAIDPNNQNRMYASVIHFGGTQGSQLGGIYRTNDINNLAGATWTKLPNPPRTEGHPSCIEVLNDGKVVCTFSGRMNPGGAFTPSSGVFLYDSALNAWTDVSDPGMYYWTMDIIIDPGDASQNTWYVCVFSGWGGPPNGLGGLYKTINRGTIWTKLTGSQFDRVSSITFNPKNLHQVYLTTEMQGLWITNDINNPTPSWTLVSGYPFRQPERVFFNPYDQDELWVTSFGNGMKVGNLNSTGTPSFNNFSLNEFQLYPNPNNGRFTFSTPKVFNISELEIFDIKGRIVFQQNLLPENNKEILDVPSLPDGIYFWEVISGQNMIAGGRLEIVN
jgi:hypothetical protein